MDNDKRLWSYSIRVPNYAPDEYKQLALLRAKEEVGLKLYSILEQNRGPAVVEIEDRVIKAQVADYMGDSDEIAINVKVTPVQYRHVELAKLDTNFAPVASPTFIERFRYAVTGKWSR